MRKLIYFVFAVLAVSCAKDGTTETAGLLTRGQPEEVIVLGLPDGDNPHLSPPVTVIVVRDKDESMVVPEWWDESSGNHGNPSGGGGGSGGSTGSGGTGNNGAIEVNPNPDGYFVVTVSANPPTGGSVSGGGNYLPHSSARVSASANDGYTFVNWTGTATVSTSTINIPDVFLNMEFVANFKRDENYVPPTEPTDPCESMVLKMGNPTFVNMLNSLQSLTSSNYEAGRAYTYSNGVYTFINHDGEPNDPGIDWNPSSNNKIDGHVHSHYNDGTLPIFSVSDILIPGFWDSIGGINNLDAFSLGTVTYGGTYFLQISNVATYRRFYNMYGSNGQIDSALEFMYAGFINSNMSIADVTTNFVRFLNATGTGMTLMKKDSDGFVKLGVNMNNKLTQFRCLK